MDRETTLRTLAAVGLSLGVIFLWTYFFGPQPQPVDPAAPPLVEEQAQPSADGVETDPGPGDAAPAPASEPAEAIVTDGAPPAGAEAVEGEEGQPNIVLTGEHRRMVLSARGARLLSLKLLDFPQVPGDVSSGDVDLVSPQSKALDHDPLYINVDDGELQQKINSVWYSVDRGPADAAEIKALGLPEDAKGIRFRWSDGAGIEVAKSVFTSPASEYLLWIDWDVRRDGRSVGGATLSWGPGIGRAVATEAKNRYAYRGHVAALVGGDVERFKPHKVETSVSWPEGLAPRWLALDTQHFAVAAIPRAAGAARIMPFDVSHLGEESENQRLAIATAAHRLLLFAGPKQRAEFARVESLAGVKLDGLVNWGFFGFLAHPLYVALSWIESGVGNWGLAIILITAVIKILFYPLTQKSMVSMRRTQKKMAELQPKMRKIKEKYRDKRDVDSRRKMNEETMALYQREGVNPMASLTGCLPMLLQLPVLYAMYTVLTAVIELRGAPFFAWIKDLSAPDPYYVTPLVMGVTMLAQQLLSMTRTEDPQQKSQQRMMLMMPVMFTFFFLGLPSGLVLYWLINNVLGIGQQVLINRHADRAE